MPPHKMNLCGGIVPSIRKVGDYQALFEPIGLPFFHFLRRRK